MEAIMHATIALLAVINPAVCASMILKLETGTNMRANIWTAIKAMLAVLLILCISAVGGQGILNVFGISMEAFQTVGGIILAFIGFRLLSGSNTGGADDESEKSLMPVVLFAASPGTITMVITLAAANDKGTFPTSTLIGAALAVGITIIIISLFHLIGKKKNGGSGQGVVSAYMGLIIAAMGLQFVLTGLKDFFG